MKKRRPAARRLHVEELEGRLALSVVTAVSTNWSGYAIPTSSGAVSAVSGSWVVPTVTGTSTAYSSVWVGIDGFSSSTVEQIGTEQDVSGGKATYYAWYEMYPKGMVPITSVSIKPGDVVSASVSYASGNSFNLTITDQTTGKSFTTTQTVNGAQRSSAEWIVEAPSSGFGVLPLANFGTASITSAQATLSAKTSPLTASFATSVYQLNMVSRSGAPEDTTSALDPTAGTVFTDTYDASSTPSPPTPPFRRPPGFRSTNIVPSSVDGSMLDPMLAQASGAAARFTLTSETSSQTPPSAIAMPTVPAPLPAPVAAVSTTGASRGSSGGGGNFSPDIPADAQSAPTPSAEPVASESAAGDAVPLAPPAPELSMPRRDTGPLLQQAVDALFLMNERGDRMWIHLPQPSADGSHAAAVAALLGALGLYGISPPTTDKERLGAVRPAVSSLTPAS
jgi:hypothetical protein